VCVETHNLVDWEIADLAKSAILDELARIRELKEIVSFAFSALV